MATLTELAAAQASLLTRPVGQLGPPTAQTPAVVPPHIHHKSNDKKNNNIRLAHVWSPPTPVIINNNNR